MFLQGLNDQLLLLIEQRKRLFNSFRIGIILFILHYQRLGFADDKRLMPIGIMRYLEIMPSALQLAITHLVAGNVVNELLQIIQIILYIKDQLVKYFAFGKLASPAFIPCFG